MDEFNDLHAKIVEFLKDHPLNFTSGRDPHTGDEWYQVEGLPKAPREWGIAVGSIGHHARSALDQMVYALAFEGGGNPESKKTTFPIYMSRDDYFSVVKKTKLTKRDTALAGVDEKWKKKIDDLQPYNRLHMAEYDPLATLVNISNRDKHRTTNAPNFALETPLFTGGIGGHQHPESLAIFYNARVDPNQPSDMKARNLGKVSSRYPKQGAFFFDRKQRVDDKLGVEVAFGGIARTYSYTRQIKRAIEHVETIIVEFEPAFGP